MSPLPDPASAPPRTDLPFLTRRRGRPAPEPAGAPPAPDAAVADFITGRAGHGARHPSAPPPTARSTPPVAPPASGSLDLSSPASASLDLSAAPTVPATTVTAPPPAPARRRPRITGAEQRILGVRDPSVWLTRVQSGVGELEVELVYGPDLGDLRLGAIYQLASGSTSTVQLAGGARFAPSSRRPVLVAGRDEYEHLRLDLRQTREIERVAIHAFSESRASLTWGGTLVVKTLGGGRIELPLETLRPGPLAVLASIYNVDGELVVRAEMETIDGDVREAARGYGYDRITWRDSRTPVD